VRAVMTNAGSALMGIGRANGENRAIMAAQQAIESPLLEVSIDGARGIIMNIIGGNDLSMHEINAAAEAITSASDPDANIIFGATINPDLDGEVIITVVATGFDASYFARGGGGAAAAPTTETPAVATHTKADEDMSKIDMSLDEHIDTMTDFKADSVPNIWTLEDNEADDELSNDKADDESKDHETKEDKETKLEEPSFLRRLAKRYKEHGDKNDEDKKS